MNLGNVTAKGKNADGFTLVELLAAIVIIAILAVLAMGATSSVLDSSRTAGCAGNLRRLAVAGLAYVADHDGRLPDRAKWGYASNKGGGSLVPYLGLSEAAGIADWDKVPGYAKAMTCPAILADVQYRPINGLRSYAINQYATGSDDSASGTSWPGQVQNVGAPVKLTGKSAALQAFFMDGPFQATSGRYSTHQQPDRLAPQDGSGGGAFLTVYPHKGCINVVFLDGHVEMISEELAMEELVGPSNPSSGQASTSPRTKPFWGATK